MSIDEGLWGQCRQLVDKHEEELITLSQRMVRVPSLPGQEGPVADLVQEAMKQLGYDQVWTDAAGNVIGVVQGGDGPVTLFNGHMDVVDAGDPQDWPYPPFGAEIQDGYMWGRGSADMKCALTGMIFAAGLFKVWGRKPAGDIIVTAVGMEEIGGWGTRLLLEKNDLNADRAVVGEPTKNRVLPGHRVRIALKVRLKGKSMHGSQASYEVNPLFSLARFLDALPAVTASLRKRLGYLSITPTLISASPTKSSNVTPANLVQTLDVRADPGITPEAIVPELNQLLQQKLGQECSGQVQVGQLQVKTYTGLELQMDDFVPGYELPADDAWLKESRTILEQVLGQDPLTETARFTCDASRLYQAGIPPIIFGPGDITLAHTTGEKIPLPQFMESVVAYMALVL